MNSVQHFVKSKFIIFTSNPVDLTFDINTKTPKHHLLILADLRTMINYDDPIVKLATNSQGIEWIHMYTAQLKHKAGTL